MSAGDEKQTPTSKADKNKNKSTKILKRKERKAATQIPLAFALIGSGAVPDSGPTMLMANRRHFFDEPTAAARAYADAPL